MKRLALLLVLLLALVGASRAQAASAAEDRIVTGGTLILGEGETVEGDLLVLGGNVEIRAGARVEGNLTLVGGAVELAGRVDGDVRIVGGRLQLRNGAHVQGDLISNGGSYSRDDDVRVDGEIRSGVADGSDASSGRRGGFILDAFWRLFVLFTAAACSVLLALFWPERLRLVGGTVVENPAMAGIAGLLTAGVVIPVLAVITITIILIPVSLGGFILLAAAGVFGWAAMSQEIGRRLATAANQTWTPAVAAGAGSLLLGVVYVGLEEIFCVGWAMQAMIGLIGLGAVALTLFGERPYLDSGPSAGPQAQ